jgi:hypothetical protein
VIRADGILAGGHIGLAVAVLGCAGVLAAGGGSAGRVLAGLVSAALLLRARLYPAAWSRLPLLAAGLLGLLWTVWTVLPDSSAAAAFATVALAGVGMAGAVIVAALARRVGPRDSPYLSRLADLLEIVTVVALAPVACAVLGLYHWVGQLIG